jgi:hypothetical protein
MDDEFTFGGSKDEFGCFAVDEQACKGVFS